jgi:hypothetical protein
MELKARGSENRHIPSERSARRSNHNDITLRTGRTDNYELLRGEGRVLGVGRHAGGITISWRGRLRSFA